MNNIIYTVGSEIVPFLYVNDILNFRCLSKLASTLANKFSSRALEISYATFKKKIIRYYNTRYRCYLGHDKYVNALYTTVETLSRYLDMARIYHDTSLDISHLCELPYDFTCEDIQISFDFNKYCGKYQKQLLETISVLSGEIITIDKLNGRKAYINITNYSGDWSWKIVDDRAIYSANHDICNDECKKFMTSFISYTNGWKKPVIYNSFKFFDSK